MTLEAKTWSQTLLVRSIKENALTLATGPAGTGKTYVSAALAAELLKTKDYRTLVLARPNISTGRSLGAFPGDHKDKLRNWLGPLITNVKSALGGADFDNRVMRNQILFQPIETIRGQSYEQALVLVDEAQNLSVNEIKAVVTRLGEDSKMVLMGDPDQSDLPNSGLAWLTALVKKHQLADVGIVEFTVDDIVRSGLVGALVRAFALEKPTNDSR